MSEARPAPGEGPTKPVSVSLHEGTIAAIKERIGKRGMSAYIEALIQRQIERDNLRELIANAEAEHGAVDRVSVAAKRAALRGEHRVPADAA